MTITASARSITDSWWREAAIYQIYPRSFSDSNGDGIGDFNGIRDRLPYLRDLGVSGIWLNPFYPSPNHDQGYDITDYTDVDPDYGTLEDFKEFLSGAHEFGLRVIIDIVANHCSIEHPLFRKALNAAPGSEARSRFHFQDGRGEHGQLPPNNWRSMFGGSAWSRVDDGQWYLHLFTAEQPDFNWRNPSTAAFFYDVLRFWLDLGVDGFRLDAAQGLFKHPDLPDADNPFEEERVGDAANALAWNQPEVHDVYRNWRKLVDTYAEKDGAERPLVGEITGLGSRYLRDYIGADQLHQGFFFEFMNVNWDGQSMREAIANGLQQARDTASPVTWVLGNHDTVRAATRYAGGAPGVSRGDEELGELRARAAALLILALPGSTYIFQGDELGLPEVTDLPADTLKDPVFRNTNGGRRGRDGCRVPIPWQGAEPPFGFTVGTSTWLPQPEYFSAYSVETERAQRDSTWNLYQKALAIRKEHLAGNTMFRSFDVGSDVIAFDRGEHFTCVVNAGDVPVRSPMGSEPTLTSCPFKDNMMPPNTTAWWVH
ncbi:alpha-amylase family glycosyl hydrolase [Arthrobacter sp. ISL-72]|uniref:alpha-amylase family glycosyl hydrolase n=1 Tax=Arthrobacter sp. ISL-72 TaxID=2819114 RepID=UPI001BE8410A|nr:alpha-amylase family glycosyl hydrolase [Arthrobacter sp. ISL-72]MBT2594026.1 hypothetical protein [Arthrobacter sp. ISL-72]